MSIFGAWLDSLFSELWYPMSGRRLLVESDADWARHAGEDYVRATALLDEGGSGSCVIRNPDGSLSLMKPAEGAPQ